VVPFPKVAFGTTVTEAPVVVRVNSTGRLSTWPTSVTVTAVTDAELTSSENPATIVGLMGTPVAVVERFRSMVPAFREVISNLVVSVFLHPIMPIRKTAINNRLLNLIICFFILQFGLRFKLN